MISIISQASLEKKRIKMNHMCIFILSAFELHAYCIEWWERFPRKRTRDKWVEQHLIKVDPNDYLKYEPDEGVVDYSSSDMEHLPSKKRGRPKKATVNEKSTEPLSQKGRKKKHHKTVYYEDPIANDFNPEAEQHFIKVDPNEYLKYEPDEGVVDLPSYPDEDNSNEVDIKEKPAKKQSADYDRSDNLICNICYLLCIITSAFCKVEKEEEEEEVLGMFSLKMSIKTIFVHKHFNQKFHQFVIFYEKVSTTFNIGSYLELNC